MKQLFLIVCILLFSQLSQANVECKVVEGSKTIFDGRLGAYPDNPDVSKGIVFFSNGIVQTFEDVDALSENNMRVAAKSFEGAYFIIATDTQSDPDFDVMVGNLHFKQLTKRKVLSLQWESLETTQKNEISFTTPQTRLKVSCRKF